MTDRAAAAKTAALTAAASLTLTACAALPLRGTTTRPAAPATHTARPARITPGQAAGLLPFTPAQLTSAAALACRFAAAWSTWSWRQPPAAWLAALTPVTAGQLSGMLAQAAATPGILAHRTRHRQAATARASGLRIRDLTPGSVTVTLTVRQVMTSTSGTATTAAGLAVTLTRSAGGRWQVWDIEPAAAGSTG
jgi:hypothetical protein